MAKSVLSRYLDPTVLSRIANRRIEPRGLVLGNLAGAHKSPLSGFAVEFRVGTGSMQDGSSTFGLFTRVETSCAVISPAG